MIFLQQSEYIIGSRLDLSNLSHVDVDIQGGITFTNDTDYWQENAFQFDFQDARSFFLLGGEDVHVYGGGALEGNGQLWWDLFYTNKTVKRPILFATVGLHGGSVSDLSLNNSPFWTNIVANSSDVVFTDIRIRAVSHTFSFEKNTDGWDIIQSDHITIQNSTVTNGDGKCACRAERTMLILTDCVSFKPNATNILVQNLSCNGTHGISVGSLGQYLERIDIVENILVRNISMYNSSEGARIKVWPDSFSEKSANLNGGGGSGSVRNVTYDGMWLDNVDYGITITQCYGQDDEEECFKHPVSICCDLSSTIHQARLLMHFDRHASTLQTSPSGISAAGLIESLRLSSLIWFALAQRHVLTSELRILISEASTVPTKPRAAMLTLLFWILTVRSGARVTIQPSALSL